MTWPFFDDDIMASLIHRLATIQGDQDKLRVQLTILTNLTRNQGKTQERLMSKMDEMNTALDELASTVSEAHTEILAQLAVIVAPGTSDADMDAAVARIKAVSASVKADVDALKADNPAAPV